MVDICMQIRHILLDLERYTLKVIAYVDYVQIIRITRLQIMLPIVAHEHCVLQTEVMLIKEVDK